MKKHILSLLSLAGLLVIAGTFFSFFIHPSLVAAAGDCSTVSDVDISECQALVDFGMANSGVSSFSVAGGWYQAWSNSAITNVCNRGGIVCSGGHIVAFDVAGYNFITLPSSIGNLIYLKILRLPSGGNGHINTIPASIGNLTSLKILNLSSHDISSLPVEIGNLTSLTGLILASNDLTSLPSAVGNLVNLTALNLIENDINSLPAEVGNWTHISWLSLGGNNLTSLPSAIGNWTELTYLNIGSNDITSLPAEVGNWTELTYLGIGGNGLTSLPAGVGNWTELTGADLTSNDLTALPAAVSGWVNLTSIRLTNNHLTVLPVEIGAWTSLTNIFIDNNDLTALPSSIGQLTNLVGVTISSNDLTALPVEVGNRTHIAYLIASQNHITSLPASVGSRADLIYVDMSDNNLTSLPAEVGNWINVENLYFSNNQLTSLPVSVANRTKLTNIGISYNQLTSLPTGIGNWIHIPTLYLNDNDLTALPAEIGNLTGLTDISLAGNSLVLLPAEMLHLVNLTNLDLSDNSLITLPAGFDALSASISAPGNHWHRDYIFGQGDFLDSFYGFGWEGSQTIENDNLIASTPSSIQAASDGVLALYAAYAQGTGGSYFSGYIDVDIGTGIVPDATNSVNWINTHDTTYRYQLSSGVAQPTNGTIVFTGAFGGSAAEDVEYGFRFTISSGYDITDTNNSSGGLYSRTAPVVGGGGPIVSNSSQGYAGGGVGTGYVNQPYTTINSSPQATELPNVVQKVIVPLKNILQIIRWAYQNKIIPVTEKSSLYSTMTRYEAATMMVNFVVNVQHRKIVHNEMCNIDMYEDHNSFAPDMKTVIQNICDLGLMGLQSDRTNLLSSFRAGDVLTLEELEIVMGRYLNSTTTSPRSNYAIDLLHFLHNLPR